MVDVGDFDESDWDAAEPPSINPLSDMTGDKLRAVAHWLDAYDAMAIQYLADKNPEAKVIEAITGKQIQEDLRRWAGVLDGR